ncbi:HesA/MoeB/ThiF family protein [Aliidiomarina sanyensis]|uniref:Molybdopterin-synthase adenylyltransferase MoeB n=1 Tax=Aliidiomarina sanyensis TaxID=1249555 RepID=A0A432WRG2_9GAMM|nr:molybdopterin-synthase adenylyltransferase MoeB [Aliidiomarina sanyensis]RUO36396.1 molybdopterin-synthase adenylyltransferase MoeB [Aliidiomarina sanyensis]
MATEREIGTIENNRAEQLSETDIRRYSRQMMLKQVDFEGQERLKSSHVLIVGMGGLGNAAAPYICASGVGTVTCVDFDTVEMSNLQRQTLFTDHELGKNKAFAAVQRLQALNPHIAIHAYTEAIQPDWLRAQLSTVDVVLDCTDNLSTRELLNELCFQSNTPLVSGAAIRFEGQIAVFPMTNSAPCYRCYSQFFKEKELSCMEAGVLGPVVGVIGSFQALEALKVLLQLHNPNGGTLLHFDALHSEWQSFQFHKHENCSICAKRA